MRQHFKQLQVQLGWEGMSGVVLLVLAGVFHFLALQPLELETAFMHSRLEAVHPKAGAHGRSIDWGDRQNELGMFFDSLPSEREVTDILASISLIAEASGVELKQAEYRLDAKSNPRLEYGLFFPVQGGYANIRHFVFRVLAEYPSMSLDQINFQRDRINDPVLKADIRFTLFLRPTVSKP